MNVYNYKNRMREAIIISDGDYLTKSLQMSLFLRFNLCCQLELLSCINNHQLQFYPIHINSIQS